MTKFTFNMPDIGEGIAEAEIVQWHKQVGDIVREDEEFVDMMTDKATVPMESPVTGKILEIAGEEGDMVAIGSMLVVIEIEGEGTSEGTGDEETRTEEVAPVDAAPAPRDDEVATRIDAENPDAGDADKVIAAAGQDILRAEPAATPPPSGTAKSRGDPSTGSGQTREGKVLASPAVRKRAKELGVDLAEVRPAGDGRVRHGDLDQFLSYNARYAGSAPRRPDEERKVIGMRRRIAENMAASKRNIPHFSYVEEVDVTDLEALRAQLNANRGERPKLTILPLPCGKLTREPGWWSVPPLVLAAASPDRALPIPSTGGV